MKALLLLAALACHAADSPKKLFESGKYEELLTALSQDTLTRLRSSDQRQAYLYLGMTYERLGQLEEALGVYQLGAKLFPRDINLLSQLATLLHRMGLEEQAEPLYRKVLTIHPNNALSHKGLAQIDHKLGLLDRSAGHYERALETMSDSPSIWRDYAELLLSLRDHKTAELAVRKSLALSEQPETLFVLARAERAAGRLDDALATLKTAIARFPARSDLVLARALWLLEASRDSEALAAAESSIDSGAADPLAYWIRARVHLKRDRYVAAVADLKRAAAAERSAPFTAQAAQALLQQLGAAP